MPSVDPAEHLRHAREAGERIASAGEGRLQAPVPSCPGYDLGRLLFHTGGFCRFARESLRQGGSGMPPELDYSDRGDDPLAWHQQEHTALVAELESAGPDDPCWSWGSDQRRAFWFRRAAQELAVHCWDAEQAAGRDCVIDPTLAADGIDELLLEFGPSVDNFLQRDGAAVTFGGDGETLHFHATDLDGDPAGEWLVEARPDRFVVSHEHGKGDVAARGTASDLLLFLWGRVGLERLEVFGDRSLLERWSERVSI